MTDLTSEQYEALIDLAGKASHLVQEWAEVTDAGRGHLVGELGAALRRLDIADAKAEAQGENLTVETWSDTTRPGAPYRSCFDIGTGGPTDG